MSAQEHAIPPQLTAGVVSEDITSVLHDRRSTSSSRSLKQVGFRAGYGLDMIARRTLGIVLILMTVFLWTSSNFLASVSA